MCMTQNSEKNLTNTVTMQGFFPRKHRKGESMPKGRKSHTFHFEFSPTSLACHDNTVLFNPF